MTPMPAFPVQGMYGPAANGMSLRDYMAGQILPAAFEYVHKNNAAGMGLLPEEWAAKIAYSFSDAMLIQRDKP